VGVSHPAHVLLASSQFRAIIRLHFLCQNDAMVTDAMLMTLSV